MKKFANGNKKIWTSVLLAALGVVLIIWPTDSVSAIVRLLGIGLIVIGAVGVLQQAVNREDKMISRVGRSILNVLFAALGIWVLINPGLFEGILHFIVGALILVFSLKDLFIAIQEKKSKFFIIVASIGVVLGLLILINPFEAFRTFAIFAGIALAYTGIASLINELKA